jgi:hypothetical protein
MYFDRSTSATPARARVVLMTRDWVINDTWCILQLQEDVNTSACSAGVVEKPQF